MAKKPITPAEAKALHEPDQREVDRIVEDLSDKLRSYDGSRAHAIAADLLGRGKVRAAVVKAFESAGWRVKFRADQRDGDYYEFSE